MMIRGQYFDSALISDDGSEIGSQIEIASSGIIDVIEGTRSDGEEDGGMRRKMKTMTKGMRTKVRGSCTHTYNEPYRKRLS